MRKPLLSWLLLGLAISLLVTTAVLGWAMYLAKLGPNLIPFTMLPAVAGACIRGALALRKPGSPAAASGLPNDGLAVASSLSAAGRKRGIMVQSRAPDFVTMALGAGVRRALGSRRRGEI